MTSMTNKFETRGDDFREGRAPSVAETPASAAQAGVPPTPRGRQLASVRELLEFAAMAARIAQEHVQEGDRDLAVFFIRLTRFCIRMAVLRMERIEVIER